MVDFNANLIYNEETPIIWETWVQRTGTPTWSPQGRHNIPQTFNMDKEFLRKCKVSYTQMLQFFQRFDLRCLEFCTNLMNYLH